MHSSTFSFSSTDGLSVHVYRWSTDAAADSSPRAVVQLAHGMGEHAARYVRFAEALVDAGCIVYANDHRGHGRTAGGPERHGHLGEAGWAGLVGDIDALAERIRHDHPGVPLVVFGHSMGSFALQQYLIEHSRDIDVAILSGTSAIDVIGAGIDPDAEVDLSAFNAPFEPAPTDYEWLSRDRAEVDAYVADEDCGFGLDAAGARGMLDGTAVASNPEKLAQVRSDLPIYIMSGDADPLAGGGELIELVAQRYRDAGVASVTVARYPDARHEILNETNRDQVTADLINWLDRTLS